MDYWRGLLSKLGLAPEPGAGHQASEPNRPETVEPAEVALLLLNSASRLLDQAMVPPEVSASLQSAIREVEMHIAGRPR